MQRHGMKDGGTVQAPSALVNTLTQLHKSPYMLLTMTGEKHWASFVTTHEREIHIKEEAADATNCHLHLLGGRIYIANSPD